MATVNHRLITSIDELVDPLASAHMVPMVLRPGAIRAEWSRLDLDGVLIEVADYSFPVATRGETLPGRVNILTPLRRVSGQLNGEPLVPGMLHAGGGSTEIHGAAASPISAGIVSIPTDRLEEAAVALDVDLDLPAEGEFCLVPALERPRLCDWFSTTARAARESPGTPFDPRLARSVHDDVIELVVRTFDRARRGERPIPRHRNSIRITRTCEDYAKARRYQDVTLASLCAASGVSERKIRHAFHHCYGMSPTAYLRVAALYEVRHALLEGPPRRDAVSRAASDSGFWHLSRFAGQYRALFGESPRDTLASRSTALAG